MSESGDFTCVFSGSIAEADLMKVILEEAGIRAFLDNEQTATTLPLPGMLEVNVLVDPKDAARARKVLEESSK